MLHYKMFENLSPADLTLLYNNEKREFIKENFESIKRTENVMRGGLGQCGMTEEIVQKYLRHADLNLVNELNRLRKKYYGEADDNHTWIGINPPPGTTTMKKLWSKIRELPGCYIFCKEEDMGWCVERHTQTTIREHIHLMIRGHISQRPAYIAKKLAEFFELSGNSIDVKHYRKKKLFAEHVNYIKGIKKEAKLPFVQKDIADRLIDSIPDYKLFN
jgi:hypothetical protein